MSRPAQTLPDRSRRIALIRGTRDGRGGSATRRTDGRIRGRGGGATGWDRTDACRNRPRHATVAAPAAQSPTRPRPPPAAHVLRESAAHERPAESKDRPRLPRHRQPSARARRNSLRRDRPPIPQRAPPPGREARWAVALTRWATGGRAARPGYFALYRPRLHPAGRCMHVRVIRGPRGSRHSAAIGDHRRLGPARGREPPQKDESSTPTPVQSG